MPTGHGSKGPRAGWSSSLHPPGVLGLPLGPSVSQSPLTLSTAPPGTEDKVWHRADSTQIYIC